MKKAPKKTKRRALEAMPEDADERFDWSRATRGRYAGKVVTGSPLRTLDEDLAAAFPSSQAVNDALRAILALGRVLPAVGKKGGKRSAA